jgi:7,8-dihydro-6-hydroxymethylpterin dimethyltransferase
MCIIPYATQQGEISFCAYNTGIGWRNIIEKMHMTATLTKWYEEHGRHEIFAGNKSVPLSSTEHSLKLNAQAVAAGAQTDLDELGIAKNAREEQLRARHAQRSGRASASAGASEDKSAPPQRKEMTPEEARRHAEMEKLYRQHVLKETPAPPVIQIQGLGKKKEPEPTTVN